MHLLELTSVNSKYIIMEDFSQQKCALSEQKRSICICQVRKNESGT